MSAQCESLDRFVDGELGPEQEARFREHLLDCESCQARLSSAVQLDLRAERLLGSAEAPPQPRPVVALVPRGRRTLLVAGGAMALAASVLAVVYLSRGTGNVPPEVWLAQAPTRRLEARLSDARADRYRPYDVPRSGGGSGLGSPPLEGLAALERQQDFQGIASAWLVRGDWKQAAEFLGRAQQGPDVDSDLSAVALGQDRADEALGLADRALKARPGHSQALWNRGLALRQLGLGLKAAEAFEQVAAAREPGWSEEAARLASGLRSETLGRKQAWEAAMQAGRAMVEQRKPMSREQVAGFPGLARLYLYDAVRASSSAEQVLGLLPVAEQLDGIDSGTHLVTYVRQVASRDFTQRRPLAETYARLALGALPPAELPGFLTRLRGSKQTDLLLGALIFSPTLLASMEEYSRLALATGDPWFELLAVEKQAAAEVGRGEFSRAEARLLGAVQRCGGTVRLDYRCGIIEWRLATSYLRLHRPQEARRHILNALRRSVRGNNWGTELTLLQDAGQLAANVEGNLPLAHAYLEEYLARQQSPSCAQREFVHSMLAAAHHQALDFDGALRELNRLEGCEAPPSLTRAFAIADLARLRPQPRDEQLLRQALEAVRAAQPQSPGRLALATHIEGRFELARDRALGQSLLRRAIAEADPLPSTDVEGRKARAYSYTSLILDAGKHGAHDEALALFAAELKLAPAARCVLAVMVEDERTFAVLRDAEGKTHAAYDESRTRPSPAPRELVPEKLVASLRACGSVEVLARPPVLGSPGLLPADLAWSYRVSPGTGTPSALPSRRVIVTDIELPEELRPTLPRLEGQLAVDTSGNTLLLRGYAATRSRVLESLASATEVAIHTHGLMDLSIADASFLVLSKDDDGRFTLTARDVQEARLAGQPVVLLAACYSGQTRPSLHESFGLPTSFIQAGARVVLATTEQLPNREAGEFFERVLTRIRAGEAPAVVLRDERLAWLKSPGTPWVEHVLLFQ